MHTVARVAKGRPKKHYPGWLCERMNTLHKIFAWGLPKAEWVKMNRPMVTPYDEKEEVQRLIEYSKTLQGLSYSELVGRCDEIEGYPYQILRWQYSQGLLSAANSEADTPSERILGKKNSKDFAERQSEYASSLALFIVAEETKISPEYLRKLCRKWDPHAEIRDTTAELSLTGDEE